MNAIIQTQIARLRNLPTFYERLFTRFCQECVILLHDHTPGHRLPDEWTFEVHVSNKGVSARVWNTREDTSPGFDEILFYLDMGTSAHWVFPVNARALSWVENGVRYFSKGHIVSGITAAHFDSKCRQLIASFDRRMPGLWQAYFQTGALP